MRSLFPGFAINLSSSGFSTTNAGIKPTRLVALGLNQLLDGNIRNGVRNPHSEHEKETSQKDREPMHDFVIGALDGAVNEA